jgi:1,4-dihydroxy-2-naphthoate octaprenyltransferase
MAQPARMSRRDIWIHLLLYPGHTLPTAAAPVLVGVGLAVHDHVFAALPALLGFVASWLFHVGGVFTDNYELLVRHPHTREHPELTDALADGTLTLAGLRWAILACFGLPALAGPYLLQVGGLPVLGLAGIGIAASWLYAGVPFPFAKFGLAEPIFFLMFGIVAVAGTYYVQAAFVLAALPHGPALQQLLPLNVVVLGLPVGALVTNVLIIDDIRDHAFDAEKGWRTGAVRFGSNWSRTEFIGLAIFSYLIPFWFWLGLGFGAWVLLPLLTLPWAIIVARVVVTHDRREQLFPMTPKASALALAYAVLLAIGVAVSAY